VAPGVPTVASGLALRLRDPKSGPGARIVTLEHEKWP
jgi:hypothetical protein